MSMFYKLAYLVGFTPWERAGDYPPAKKIIIGLFDREEANREKPFGKALDLGCGRGNWSIELARRGWDVTGIDLEEKAVSAARINAEKAGVEITAVAGDVTKLEDSGVGTGFDLVWDFGTVHGLTKEQQRAVGRGLNLITSGKAVLLMLAWAPGNRGPLPWGMSREDIESAYEGWKVTDVEPFDATGLPKPLRKVDPKIYRLERRQ